MKNSRRDSHPLVIGLMIAWLAAYALPGCHRRTLTAGALKATPDAGAQDGASLDSGSPDVAEPDAHDADIDSSLDGLPPSGPCGQATCLTALFQTCVPEGSCTTQGGGSPSAVFWSASYANGVQVSSVGSGTGAGTSSDWSVRRDQTPCYAVKGWAPTGASGMTYTITGASGEQVATGESANKTGLVTVTCDGGEPTLVSSTCLQPPGSTSSCSSGGSPSDTGGSGGAGETSGTGGTGGSTGGAGGSTSTDSANTLRCTLARGPDSEPGSTCKTYCDDLQVMCTSTAGVPATSAECVSSCQANLTEAQLCCRAAHLLHDSASTACESALGRGACP